MKRKLFERKLFVVNGRVYAYQTDATKAVIAAAAEREKISITTIP